jgi:hypothetical protein
LLLSLDIVFQQCSLCPFEIARYKSGHSGECMEDSHIALSSNADEFYVTMFPVFSGNHSITEKNLKL